MFGLVLDANGRPPRTRCGDDYPNGISVGTFLLLRLDLMRLDLVFWPEIGDWRRKICRGGDVINKEGHKGIGGQFVDVLESDHTCSSLQDEYACRVQLWCFSLASASGIFPCTMMAVTG